MNEGEQVFPFMLRQGKC